MNKCDLIIIGGGPAGVAAGVYAARKRLNTLLLTNEFGGQSAESTNIQNWIGIPSFPGIEMAKKLKEHLKAYADNVLEFKEGVKVVDIAKAGAEFRIETENSGSFLARALIVASGARRRKLQVKGTDRYEGNGVVYCASCDAPLFSDKDVAVIGGGNSGLETAEQLVAYANKIYILEFGPEFKGDAATKERVFANKKVFPLTYTETLEIKGEQFVTGLVYKDRSTQEQKEIEVQGVFVEIGSIPNTDFIKNLVEVDERGEIVVNHKNARTSVEGIWAAGDCTNQPYKQNNISMGDAVKALEDAYLWIKGRSS